MYLRHVFQGAFAGPLLVYHTQRVANGGILDRQERKRSILPCPRERWLSGVVIAVAEVALALILVYWVYDSNCLTSGGVRTVLHYSCYRVGYQRLSQCSCKHRRPTEMIVLERWRICPGTSENSSVYLLLVLYL